MTNEEKDILDQSHFGAPVGSTGDYRHIPLAAIAGAPGDSYPESFFIDDSKLSTWHQKKNGSCTGHAKGKQKQAADLADTGNAIPLSPRFLYGMSKKMDKEAGYPDYEGTFYENPLKVLKNIGCMTEKWVPNDSDLPHDAYIAIDALNLPPEAWKEAELAKIEGYAFPNVKDENDLKRSLMTISGGVALGMSVDQQWYTAPDGRISWAENDILPIRPPKQRINGHDVWLKGWDTVSGRTRFWFKNSWGPEWGRKGDGYFFFDEMKNHLEIAITITDIPNKLLEQVHALPTKDSFKHYFARRIGKGEKSDEVRALQTALLISGDFDSILYAELLRDNQLGYFGEVTRKALLSYMVRKKVASIWDILFVNGRWTGPATLKQLNVDFCGCVV